MRARLFLLLSVVTLAALIGLNWPWVQAGAAMALHGQPCGAAQLAKAHKRLKPMFGAHPPHAIVRCLKTGQALGLNVTHGTTRFAPGLPAVVVIGPQGHNADVMAHELAHAHIADMSSTLLRTYKLPTWFDEGLAMQFDHRANYSLAALRTYQTRVDIAVPPLASIATPATFFRSTDQGKAHYAFARCVVAMWIADGNDAASLVKSIGWRTDFPAHSFIKYERACAA